MSSEGTSARVSNSSTNTLWFQRFMQGCHRRMGDMSVPDTAVNQYVVRICFEITEEIWQNNQDDLYARMCTTKAMCM